MSRPRIRTIKPDIWQDEAIGSLDPWARLLFLGLITMADDEGRLRNLGAAIRGHVFSWDEKTVKAGTIPKLLNQIEGVGLILRYKVGSGDYIVLRGWSRHQRINKPIASELPPPPDAVIVEENGVADSGTSTVSRVTRTIPEAVRRAVARREGAEPGADTEVSCSYCGFPGIISWATTPAGRPGSWVRVEGLEFDHVVPLSLGGETTPENLVLACTRCNRSKGARPVTESRTENARNPVRKSVRDASRAEARVHSTPLRSIPTGDESVGEQQKVTRAKSRPVDPDSLPKDFPERLTAIVDEQLLPALQRLQEERGGIVPTRRGVAQAVRAWPDRDHLGELAKFEHYYTAGGGASADVGDWPRRLRTWLEKAPAASPGRPAVNVRDERRKRGAEALRNLMASTEGAV